MENLIKKKKIISILLIFAIILNLFMPYTSLGYYQEDGEDKVSYLRVSDIYESSSGNYVFYVEYGVMADAYVGSFDISLSYDTDLFGTARKTTGAASSTVAQITERNTDYWTFQISTVSSGTIRMTCTTTDWYQPDDLQEDYSDKYGYELYAFRVYFYLLDSSAWELDGSAEITTDMISWLPTSSLATGYKQRVADDDSGTNSTYLTNLSYVSYDGFKEDNDSPKISSIQIVDEPTKTNYIEGDTIDYTGGTVKLTYDDNTEETKTIDEAISEGLIVADTTTANSTKTVTFSSATSSSVTTTWNYYVLDSISVETNPSNLTYEHGDTIDYSGGSIKATYTNAASTEKTESIDMTSSDVTKDMTTADYNNQTVTLTYGQKTTTVSLTVTDPVESIAITTTPTTIEYSNGDAISLAGGIITATTKSGATSQIATNSSSVSADTTTANINLATKTWENTSNNSLTSGYQPITLTYEGKTASYNILVNDTVSSVSFTTQPTAQNLYGTQATSLDFSGLVATVTTSGGGTFTVNADSLTIDTSSYSSSILTKQSLPATYGTVSSDNDVEITLVDYVTGITATITNSTVDYDTPLSDVLSGATYVLDYASGATSASDIIAESMVSGYTQAPASSDFDSNHQDAQTITITYTDGTTYTDSVVITMNDVLTGIEVVSTPTKTEYDYGETFSTTSGKIKEVYASGADGDTISMGNSSVSLTETDETTIDMTPTASEFTNGTLTKTILVTYTKSGETYTTTFNIKINDTVASIAIDTDPTKTFYHGDTFSVGSGTLSVTYSSGATSTVSMTDSNVTITQSDGTTAVDMTPTSYDSTQTYTESLLVDYKDITTSYNITIINDIQSISIQTPAKTSYNVNDKLDISTGEILVVRAVGTNEVLKLDGSDISVSGASLNVTGFDSSVENTSLTLTVTYTESGISKETKYNVSVTDSVTSIAMNSNPTKTEYKYGESLDLTGATIDVTKGSGTTTIDVTENMVSGYNANTLGQQTITVTYGGETATFTVEVKDYVTGISITPSTVTGTYGDTITDILNNNITYTVTYASAGAQTPATLTSDMISSVYNANTTSTQSLTITYTDSDTTSATKGDKFTATLGVTLIDTVLSISLDGTPKTDYKYGESLETLTMTVVRDSGKETMTIPTSAISGYNPTTLGTQTITISYGGQQTTYDVTVSDYVTDVILTAPTKLTYEYGASLDLAGGSVQKVMASGAATTPVALTDSSVKISNFDPYTIGAQTINVTYEGKTLSFGVIVEDNIQSIAIANTPKTNYKYGESLDLTGATIEVTKGSGTTTIDVTESMVSGYNPIVLGAQVLTVTYEEKQTSYTITVEDYAKDISIVKPDKLIYNINNTIDLTGGTVSLVMASGTATTPVAMSDTSVTITGFDTTTTGVKTLTVSYEGFTKTFTITVVDPTSGITINTLPNKTDYLYGESLDLTGATIEVTKLSGLTEIVDITTSMVSGYSSTTLGTQILTVTYDGQTVEFAVNVEDYVKELKVTAPEKTEYEYGENLDLTGGTVSVIMASGKIDETVELTASMISGYDKTKEGTQTITVEYKDLSGKFTVTLEDKVKAISINTQPNKIEYEYGESLDLTGATITVIKSSGIYTIDVTNDMISGYDSSTPGTQVITVTYEGFETKFIVIVNEQEETDTTNTSTGTTTSTTTTTTSSSSNTSTSSTLINTPVVKDIVPDDEDQDGVVEEDKTTEVEDKVEEKTDEEEKPTAVLGAKDENNDDENIEEQNDTKMIAGTVGAIGILILLFLLFAKKNTKIYVTEDNEFVLGGTVRLSRRNKTININEYLDGETYGKDVKVVLNRYITEKLDGEEIEIKHREETIKYKVQYEENKPYEIILK